MGIGLGHLGEKVFKNVKLAFAFSVTNNLASTFRGPKSIISGHILGVTGNLGLSWNLGGEWLPHPPTKFFQEKGLSACFQASGQAMRTVLCFMPPRPADWIRWDAPSRRLEDTTSWQKPFVFSALIRERIFCGSCGGEC